MNNEGLKRTTLPDRVWQTKTQFVKQMLCAEAGTIVEQHVHAYDHITMIAAGAFRVWKNDVHIGDFEAPTGIIVDAGIKHMFQSLAPNSIAYCFHDIRPTGEVEIVPSESILERLL
jgi:quercetin dioxygenase-like cupin family protein